MLRIKAVEGFDGFTARLVLTDGTLVERDLSPLLVEPLYASLRSDPVLLGSAGVVDGTLAWPNGLDLDPDMIIWGGPPPAEARRTG